MLDFPNVPLVGELFTSGTIVWRWDGIKWTGGGAGNFIDIPASMLLVNTTVALPSTFHGFVRVENPSLAPVTLALSPTPVSGQNVTIKDCFGNAGTYPITVTAQGGKTIEGQPSMTIHSDFGWLDLSYTGAQWVQS